MNNFGHGGRPYTLLFKDTDKRSVKFELCRATASNISQVEDSLSFFSHLPEMSPCSSEFVVHSSALHSDLATITPPE